jgi:hypothetical protein
MTGEPMAEPRPEPRFFAPLPVRGIWTALDLGRGQFLWILGASLVLFAFVGGPLWSHARESHFWRLLISYLVIPPAVAWALWRNGKLRWLRLLVASAVVSAIKLVLTALMLVAVGIFA